MSFTFAIKLMLLMLVIALVGHFNYESVTNRIESEYNRGCLNAAFTACAFVIKLN